MASFRPHCCRFEAALHISPLPIYYTSPDRLAFFTPEGKAVVGTRSVMDCSCQIHKNYTPLDLLFGMGVEPKQLPPFVIPPASTVLDWKHNARRAQNVFMRTALQWRTVLHANLVPSLETAICILFSRTEHWPAGVYLCINNGVCSSRMVWNTESNKTPPCILPVFPGVGTFHSIYGVRARPGSALYMSDHLYFSLLECGVPVSEEHEHNYPGRRENGRAGSLCYCDGHTKYYWLLYKDEPLGELGFPTTFKISWGADNKPLQHQILHSLFGLAGIENLHRHTWQDPVTKITYDTACSEPQRAMQMH
ncbi:ORF95 [Ranid herpesvirus 2]|uniref:ORF95 n=1 Tax=Ranid herpesvirus 2 TaxID=389214 RepID=Q14W11_9VIRU|nr:ORF95 [Ranid herpesvirus 2]ABG25646.1 ORF95 [Ranid herpesvirus 2]